MAQPNPYREYVAVVAVRYLWSALLGGASDQAGSIGSATSLLSAAGAAESSEGLHTVKEPIYTPSGAAAQNYSLYSDPWSVPFFGEIPATGVPWRLPATAVPLLSGRSLLSDRNDLHFQNILVWLLWSWLSGWAFSCVRRLCILLWRQRGDPLTVRNLFLVALLAREDPRAQKGAEAEREGAKSDARTVEAEERLCEETGRRIKAEADCVATRRLLHERDRDVDAEREKRTHAEQRVADLEEELAAERRRATKLHNANLALSKETTDWQETKRQLEKDLEARADELSAERQRITSLEETLAAKEREAGDARPKLQQLEADLSAKTAEAAAERDKRLQLEEKLRHDIAEAATDPETVSKADSEERESTTAGSDGPEAGLQTVMESSSTTERDSLADSKLQRPSSRPGSRPQTPREKSGGLKGLWRRSSHRLSGGFA